MSCATFFYSQSFQPIDAITVIKSKVSMLVLTHISFQ